MRINKTEIIIVFLESYLCLNAKLMHSNLCHLLSADSLVTERRTREKLFVPYVCVASMETPCDFEFMMCVSMRFTASHQMRGGLFSLSRAAKKVFRFMRSNFRVVFWKANLQLKMDDDVNYLWNIVSTIFDKHPTKTSFTRMTKKKPKDFGMTFTQKFHSCWFLLLLFFCFVRCTKKKRWRLHKEISTWYIFLFRVQKASSDTGKANSVFFFKVSLFLRP